MKPNTTQQINNYVRSQQQLMKQRQNTGIKKANCIRQDNQSAFTTKEINLIKVNSFNKSAQGAN